MNLMIPPSQESGMSVLQYLFPGLMIFALLSIGLFGTSVPIIEMRQKGTLRLFQLAPLSKNTFIFSQIAVRLILSFIQIVIFLILGSILGYVRFADIPLLFLVSVIDVIFMLTLGFLFGGLFKSIEVASGLLSVLMVPVLMISGVMMPISILPDLAKKIALALPFTYMGDSMRQIMYGTKGEFSVLTDIGIIMAFTVLVFLITRKTFHWSLEKL